MVLLHALMVMRWPCTFLSLLSTEVHCLSVGPKAAKISKLQVVGKVVIHRFETNEPGEDR